MPYCPTLFLCASLLFQTPSQDGGAADPSAEVVASRATALASEKAEHAAALASLSPDWSHFETEHFLVLSHTEERDAKRVAEQGGAVLNYLAEKFAQLGAEAYVRRPILRVCRDVEERRAFAKQRENSSTWLPRHLEILGCLDPRGVDGYEFGYMNVALIRHFLKERACELNLAMPPWLAHGLEAQIKSLRVDKYGKIEFLRDDWDRDELTVQTQLGRGIPLRELFRMTEAKFGSGNALGRYAQSDALVRYLFSPESEKNARTKGLLQVYLCGLGQHAAEHSAAIAERAAELAAEAAQNAAAQATADPATPSAPEIDHDPEESAAGWRRKAWLDAEEAVVEDLYFRAFRAFEEKDWKNFEKSFTKFID